MELRDKTVRRIPLDFDWALGEMWHGYLNPWPAPLPCPTCGGLGYGPQCLTLFMTFDRWSKKLTRKEELALYEYGFSPKDVEMMRKGKVKGEENPRLRLLLVEIRIARKNLRDECETCAASGEVPNSNPAVAALYEGVDLYELWKPTEPPYGAGWQLWHEDGHPLSPVFAEPHQLAEWCCDAFVGVSPLRKDGWLQWILSINEPLPPETMIRPFRLHSDRVQVFGDRPSGDDPH